MAINPLAPPVNYLGMLPQIDLAKQFEGLGEALAQRQKQVQAEEAKAAYATDLQTVLQNPSMGEFNKFALKYPQQREVIKDVSTRFTQDQQDAEFNIGRDVAIALENDKPEVALEILGQTIEAREKAKLPIGVYGQVQQILLNTDDPDRLKNAKRQTNFALTLLNPEKFGKVVETLEKQKIKPDEGFTILSDADRKVAKLPPGTYQKGPKNEIKLLAATKEDFKLLTPAEVKAAGLPPGTYQTGPSGEVKLLSSAKENFKLLTPAEVKAAGLPPGTYQQSPTGEIKPIVKEPLVSVSVGEQGKRDTLALKELDVPRAQEFNASAASARTLARDARTITNLLKGKGGGAVIKLGADIAKTFGFSTDTVVANDLANSLAVRGATQLRAPGSGSTSDIEFKSFVSAFPSLANSEGGRELMAKYADAFAKRSAKIADHARKLIRTDKYSEEEIARFDESLGPILDKDFYESVNTGPRANVPKYVSPSAAAAPAAAPRTVDSVLQQYLPKQTK